jgi:hypothetical protein
MYSIADISNVIAAGLLRQAKQLELEQAVYGLDTHNEVKFHALLARTLEGSGYGVFREQRYPVHRNNRNRSVGVRCDLVLTPGGRALASPGEPPTLFDPPNPVALEDALWVEVKLLAQFTTAGPNRRYSSLYGAVRRDVAKLTSAQGIVHRALLILSFAQDLCVADHDLEIWRAQCAERGFDVRCPELRSLQSETDWAIRCAGWPVIPSERLVRRRFPLVHSGSVTTRLPLTHRIRYKGIKTLRIMTGRIMRARLCEHVGAIHCPG